MSTMPPFLWLYRAKLDRVIDGDSLVCVVDAGFGIRLHRGNEGAHLRLIGVDTPERNEEGWDAARLFVVDWLAQAGDDGWPLLVRTEKADSFGRYLAEVWRRVDGESLNAALLAAGHAVPYRVVRSEP